MPRYALVLAVLCASSPGLADAAGMGAASAAEPARASVNVAVADLFPDPRADVLSDQARYGEALRVLGPAVAGRVPVETELGYRAFARVADLAPLPAGAPAYDDAQGGSLLRVVARFANVYSQPDVTRVRPLLAAPLGVLLRRRTAADPSASEPGRWLPITLVDGAPAFVQAGDVEPLAAPAATAACVLREAERHRGTPYLWGGRSTYGIDCSGLVANAFLACGLRVPRDADQQSAAPALVPAAPAALQPGDLLFFGQRARPGAPERVTHVGVYRGEGRFLHATTADHPEVQESLFGAERWQRVFLHARRHPALH